MIVEGVAVVGGAGLTARTATPIEEEVMTEKIRGDITQGQAYTAIENAGACWLPEDMYARGEEKHPAYERWLTADENEIMWVLDRFCDGQFAHIVATFQARLNEASTAYNALRQASRKQRDRAWTEAENAPTQALCIEARLTALREHDATQARYREEHMARRDTINAELLEALRSPAVYRKVLRAVKRSLLPL
jgi:hypothetical protein